MLDYITVSTARCLIFYQNDNISLSLFNISRKYIETKLLGKLCEYREMYEGYIFQDHFNDPFCQTDVSVLIIAGDLLYNFMAVKECTAALFYIYNTSPRSFSNPLIYSDNTVTFHYENVYVVGSSFPFVENKRSEVLKNEIETIIGKAEEVLFEDFVSLYLYFLF